MPSYTDGHVKLQNQVRVLLWKYIYILFCWPNALLHLKSLFSGHIYVKNCLKIHCYNCYDFAFKKMFFSIQKETPWCTKSVLNSIFSWHSSLTTFVSWKNVYSCLLDHRVLHLDSFWNFARKWCFQTVNLSLSTFFFLCKHSAHQKCWGIFVKDSKFLEVFILRHLLIASTNKTSKVFTSKLATDLI